MSEPIILIHRAQDHTDSMPAKYGLELDVRSFGERAVLSHGPTVWADPIDEGDLCRVDHFLSDDQRRYDIRPCYAWYLREDGVEEPLARLLADFPEVRARSFVFGGSYPTMRRVRILGLATATRFSEEEPSSFTYVHGSTAWWMDRWDWDGNIGYLRRNQPDQDPMCDRYILMPDVGAVYAASPELRAGHSPMAWLRYHWQTFFRLGVAGICTDHPIECEQAYEAWKAEGKK